MSEEVQEVQEVEPVVPAAEGEEGDTGVSIRDLLVLAQTVQVCSKRGAINPDEFVVVGAAYDKLVAFLRASGQMVPQDDETAGAEESEEVPLADAVADAASTDGE